ncbi:hypothetical protein PAXRUDRAFT_165548 [Paxillus rubicundulus Ve08.2h10]|uniref:Unplaced genomic scaffold scaffold_1984, whole genome shotgun sequence n=1 Tax=Paxillus rubicundulus Ve08.2h10 TaxID=930991 RepID=A0A0D0DB80_9AGAM|nr:hypothetical protein PAXRUDRAFT_165548 [Paxillus rubicundulus Ve08.2h10]
MSATNSPDVFHADIYPGLCDAVSPTTASTLELLDVSDDMTAEQEILPVAATATNVRDLGEEFTQLQATLLDASKGVTEGMDAEYKRLMQQCEFFLIDMGWLQHNELFFCKTPHPEAPAFIVAWIMNA